MTLFNGIAIVLFQAALPHNKLIRFALQIRRKKNLSLAIAYQLCDTVNLMKSYTYLFINIAVIIFPLLLSFDKKVSFYKKWPAVWASIAVVGIPYIIWDSLAAFGGHWDFNHAYITGAVYLFNLPLEEVLFFITIPYSCLFVYEVILGYLGAKKWNIPLYIPVLLAVFAVAAAFLVKSHYTMLVLLVFSGFIIAGCLVVKDFFKRREFYLFIGVSLIMFLIVNSILTALPVIVYNSQAITGIRAGTIPLEDFFYCIGHLGFQLIAYIVLKEKIFTKKQV